MVESNGKIKSVITNHTKDSLIAFEREIADLYEAGKIHSPVHLRGGNEDQLLDIFQNIKDNSWVVTTWSSHLECLLRGVPPEEIKAAILNNKSITLCFKEYKVISSAIVGSTPSIANGLGLAAQLKGTNEQVFCFIGDCGALTGQAQENFRYAMNHKLPVTFIVADNGLSVKTPTAEVWALKEGELESILKQFTNVIYYKYKNTWPHSGTGKYVNLW